MKIDNNLELLESLLDKLIEKKCKEDKPLEDFYIYVCMLLASDKIENNIKLSTKHKIEDLKEYYKML